MTGLRHLLLGALGLGLALAQATAAAPADTPPKPIKRAQPVYPYNVAKAGLTGKVEVEFIIDTEGRVINPHVVRSNNPWFERPALDAILGWKFEPGRQGGKVVNVRATQSLEFQLDHGAGRDLWRVPRRNDQPDLSPELQWTKAPEPVGTAFPVYPWADLMADRDGSVTLRFIIGPDGRVAGAKVAEATTPEMAQAVLAMIDTWEFTPPEKADGTRCFAAMAIQHDFRTSGLGDVPVTVEARRLLRLLAKSPDKIVLAAALDQRPRPLSLRPPVYPASLRQAGQTGQAVVEFLIDEHGDAQLPRVVSSTVPEFGYAAVQAVATWRFEPPRKGGKPVVTRAQVPMDFALPAAPAAPK